MADRLKQDVSTGPAGEVIKVNWMPGNRVRIDFRHCGSVVVTKVFPISTKTQVEFSYDKKD